MKRFLRGCNASPPMPLGMVLGPGHKTCYKERLLWGAAIKDVVRDGRTDCLSGTTVVE